MDIGQIWDLIILNPVINVLIVLSDYLFNNLGLALIVLTIVIRVLMYPLTVKQLRATKAMQSIQSQIAELQKKYAKDKQKLAQEQMRLYKESGMNPAGCLVPMLIQFPVWIALYQSIIRLLAAAPEGFLDLAPRLYPSWSTVLALVPLESRFLWLDLAVPDRWLLLPLLVGGTMWMTQKMTMVPTADPKQQAQGKMMLWMMPMMFVFLTLQFPSGLALYWVISNVIQIVMQYFVAGWGGLAPMVVRRRGISDKKVKGLVARQEATPEKADLGADIVVPSSTPEEELDYGKPGDKRQDRGGGYPARLRAARRKPGGGGGHRHKRR